MKRARAVKDELRNTRDGASDEAMEAAAGLHNLRVEKRNEASEGSKNREKPYFK